MAVRLSKKEVIEMYQCYNCDATFEKPIKIINYHGLDEPPYEILMGCPVCNSDDIELIDDEEEGEEE